ncbi:MAG: hydrogenase nickel incorporation protein HypB [Bacteroidetes bacterium]|nr:hydrogenase nickel incorporation protein HypB [Bacteroidota bacterium]
MCDTCGCDQPNNPVTFNKPGEKKEQIHNEHAHNHTHPHTHNDGNFHNHEHFHMHSHEYSENHEHPHTHNHDHEHEAHTHDHSHNKVIQIEQDVLHTNNLLAERNRGYFEAKNIAALNIVSSPGSGKTTLLEKTINDLKNELTFFVIEGDQQTMNDANRINATGTPVIQINTGNGCHLDADMINKAVKKLEVADNSVLVIENVGNLVCPSLFDLGEGHRVVIISVTEGDDKPIKYPNMFHTSDICIINKIDLLPYVDFNIEKAKEYALHVNPHLQFFELSAKSGEGVGFWYDWLRSIRV